MEPVSAILVIVGLVVATTAAGVLWQARTGRARAARADLVVAAELGVDGGFGARGTLLQFSGEFCSTCGPTRRVLRELAEGIDGVVHVDVDVTARPDLAARFNILQTPTTFVLDADGVVRSRFGGAPRRSDVAAKLDELVS
ncbi:TlpA family protein disulfide reductase [Amnibacterium flavum]|uniref:Thioredoxin n=1 Tax=Amnibacterium flavum TaxID=2173173 RepID=A0A2V1HP47_9MICO|nr:thioredoxin domain-containing protein [Amnibacterium flavum]PVZ94328.1 thioredoxin [Amnibacterium flavum]